MSLRLNLSLSFVCTILLTLFLTQSLFAGDNDWRPVTPEEMAMKTPKVEPDADAEAIFWDVYVADEADGSSPRTVLRHYIRIKIFTERGREDNSKVDIPFGKISGFGPGIKLKDIAARTIKPDGSIVELDPKDIFERDLIKANRLKLRAKSFAVPAIEVGSIIEYKWKEIRGDSLTLYDRFDFAREIPVHSVTYHLKPISLPGFPYGMRAQTFNGQNTPFAKEKNGFYSTSMTNVPSFKEEPRMPPEYAIRPWMLVYYSEDTGKVDPDKYWKDYGKTSYENHKSQTKANDEIKQATAEAVGSETDPMKKLELIFNFCRSRVKNIYDDASGFTLEQMKKIKDNKNAADALKRGTGDWHDINMLFIAMATAAGFDARATNLPRRSDMNFNKNFADDYFMRTENVAVKIGEEWKFFDPSSRYIPFGMLSWEEEGQPVLISDPKEPIWTRTPYSPVRNSMEKRTGKFKLTEDGTLEGTIELQYTGHVGVYHKEYNDDDNPQQREDTLKNLVRRNILGSAEVSDISIENVTDPDKPFTYKFKVVVPGYATRTGKRLFFQPNVFERNSGSTFTSTSRRHDIFINYAWSERDSLEIELPEGYALENPDAPADLGDAQKISSSQVKISLSKDQKKIYYDRAFYFGNQGLLYFPAGSYSALKGLFDAYGKVNTHQLTLRQGSAQPALSPTKPN